MELMSVESWGPSAWVFLHACSFSYPENPSQADREGMFSLLSSLTTILPCKRCRKHYLNYFSRTVGTHGVGSAVFQSRASVSKWMVDLHNDVNVRLNKPVWQYDDVLKMYNPVSANKLSFEAEFCLGVLLLSGVIVGASFKPWVARKAIHMGIGTLLVFADLEDWRIRGSVYLANVLVILAALTIGKRLLYFLHDRTVDPGVATYLCICSLCCLLRIEFISMLPLFLADPMGAIVGRSVRTPRIYGSKTVGGTLAVWATALLTIGEPTLLACVLPATAIAVIELFGGDFDNPCIGGFLLLRALM